METVLLVLVSLSLATSIAAAVGAWRKKHSNDDAAQERLAELERRMTEQINLVRETFAKGLRDLGQDQLRAQMDFQKSFADLTEKFQGKMASSLEQLGERMTSFGDRMNEASAASRKELAEAMGGMRKAQQESADKQTESFKALQESVRTSLDQMREKSDESNAAARKELNESLTALRETQIQTLKQLEQGVTKKLDELREKNTESFSGLQERVRGSLDQMRQENEAKLEKIRLTVDEKLQSTLETRLGEKFKLVSEQLDRVHKGLGEMQTLASGVGDLKRVLTNVRSRGTFGEVQLAALLEQVMAPAQYAANVATKPGSNDRVEFAVLLPGRGEDDSEVFLPIDAKFPQEDYLRLQEAYETGDTAALEASRRGLEKRLCSEAEKIAGKYVSPPDTTDFALLFLPTEGLYAEALRLPGVVEKIQREHRIIIVGPTTLYAVLNSLQMGFRTLAIEKRSSEVWRILGGIKTEFAKFGNSLDAVKKKLQEASNKIDDSSRRSRAVERKLREVEELPVDQTRLILPEVYVDTEVGEEV